MEMPLPVREAVVTRLRASAAVTALIPAGDIHGERVPDGQDFPFVRVDYPTVTPFRTACDPNGEAVAFSIHGFFRGPSADVAAPLGGVLAGEFEDGTLTLESGEVLSVQWEGGGVLRDPDETDTWHVYVEFSAA